MCIRDRPVTACHGPSPSWIATSAAAVARPLICWLVIVIVTGPLGPAASSFPPGPPSGVRSAGGTVPQPASGPQAATSNASRTHRTVSYTHLRAHETPEHLVCRLLLEKKK